MVLNSANLSVVKDNEPEIHESRRATTSRRRKPLDPRKAAWMRYQIGNALGVARVRIEKAQERGVDLSAGFGGRFLQTIAVLSAPDSDFD